MTVSDNISYPLKVRRRSRSERSARAAEVGAQLGLSPLLDRRPAALSGGQQQRVALARAVAVRPAAFLFDEPLSNLDARLRLEARTFLKRLQRELAVTTVFVTHDQAEALALADRIAVMEAGRIRQVGTPREVFGRPANTFVANFIGSTPMNLLEGSVHDGRLAVAGAALPWKGPLADGEKVVVGVRPEYLTLSTEDPGGPALSGLVSVSENLGTSALISVAVGDELIGAVVPEEAEPPADTPVWLVPQPGRLLVYRASDGELVM
jgi:multiple sugar transport system ATP-binding protein